MTLKEIKKEKGLVTGKIAGWLGITYRQYHRIEKGQSKLDKLKSEKLSQIFELPVTEIQKAWEEGRKNNERAN